MTNPNLKKVSVLIVDEHAHMRKIVSTVLHELGIRDIRNAASPDEAIDSFAALVPDFVITNVERDRNYGLDLIYRFRDEETSANPYVRIIANSSEPTPSLLSDVRDAGADEFFMKPFSSKQLFSRVVAIADQPRPFIRTKAYFGPDRRRLDKPFEGNERRDDEADKTVSDTTPNDLLQRIKAL